MPDAVTARRSATYQGFLPRLQAAEIRGCLDLTEVARGWQILEDDGSPEAIETLQAALVRLDLLGELRDPDGVYGEHTRGAVRRLQSLHRLAESGSVDAITILVIDRALVMLSEEGPSGAHPSTTRASLLMVLHSAPCHFEAYRQAIAEWPEDEPIWPCLTTDAAREELIRYIAQVDDTQTRAYNAFDNLCTGFAAQLYARYSDRADLEEAALENLARSGLAPGRAPARLHVPLFVAINRGHAFSAFLLDTTAPDQIESYRFFDPQTDVFLTPTSPTWHAYLERFGVALSDLAGCDERGRFDLRTVHDFVLDGRGKLARVSTPTVARFVRDFAIAESSNAHYDLQVGRAGGFVSYIRRQASETWALTDGELIEAGRLLIGRRFRSHPLGEFKPMTTDRYLAMLGRVDLRAGLQHRRPNRVM
ncbi:MAG: peptidoglycan-binding domain-containing protein [Nannocystaceae bacterium]